MIANNRENLLHGFQASGMSPALANAMLEVAGTVAALHPGSREEALAELQNTFARVLDTQRARIADSELSAANIARYLNQGLDAIPLLETGLGSQLRAGAARLGTRVGGMRGLETPLTTLPRLSFHHARSDIPRIQTQLHVCNKSPVGWPPRQASE